MMSVVQSAQQAVAVTSEALDAAGVMQGAAGATAVAADGTTPTTTITTSLHISLTKLSL